MAFGTPTYGSSAAAASGDPTVTLPSNSAGDLLVIGGAQKDNSVITASGWTFLTNIDVSTNSIFLGWKRSTGSESNPTLARSVGTGAVIAAAMSVSGLLASGDPVNASGGGGGSDGTQDLDSLDPDVDDCLIVYVLGASDWDANPTFTTPDGTGPTFTEGIDVGTSLGTDVAMAMGHGQHSGQAATGARSWTRNFAALGGRIVAAFEPEPDGGPSGPPTGSLALLGVGR